MKISGSELVLMAAALCAAPMWFLASPAFAQTAASQPASRPIPRMPGGKPDFSGFFDIQYTPNMAMGKEDTVPYTAAGKAAFLNHDAKDDPTSNCWFPG